MNNLIFFFSLLFPFCFSIAQEQTTGDGINPDIISKRWDAAWITHLTASRTSHGVYYFHKVFELSSKPQQFIHISADNRYELYVNSQRILLGPSWGDMHHWRFESIDISPYLMQRQNIIAAQVVNFGRLKAIPQVSYKTGFILQNNSERES